MRRNPDLPSLPEIVGPDGRALPFDEERLRASIRRALLATGVNEHTRAEDLGSIVRTYIERQFLSPVLGVDDLAGLVVRVLSGAGLRQAARVYSRSRGRAGAGVVRRLRSLLADETDLPASTAQQIAQEVRRGLDSAGLLDASTGLLREWIDHSLQRHGLGPRLGRRPSVGVPGHELRGVLSEGHAGHAAEVRASAALLTHHALEEVFPAEVVRAHELGRIDVGASATSCRVHGMTVRPSTLPGLGGRRARARLAALAARVRDLGGLASDEVRVLWDGPDLGAEEAAELMLQVADLSGSTAPLVFCFVGSTPRRVEAFLEALDEVGEADLRVRVCGPGLADETLDTVAAHPRAELAAVGPEPEVASAAGAVNLVRPALELGPGRVDEYLDAVQTTAELCFAGLAAWEALGPSGPARARAREAVREATALDWNVALVGARHAARLLLGDHPRSVEIGCDLGASIGERVRRAFQAWRHPSGADSLLVRRLRVVPGAFATAERFGRLDGRAHTDARQRLSFSADETLVYAERPRAQDAEAAARDVARWRLKLGCGLDVPAPRLGRDAASDARGWRSFLGVCTPPPVESGACG